MASENEEIEVVEGWYSPKVYSKFIFMKSLKDHLEEIRSMNIRDDDIFVCAYPKCGTHWVWEIVNVLQTGSIHTNQKETAMLDVISAEKLDAIPSPRILNTHFPTHLLPVALLERKAKIIYVYRNPKDVAISAYYFFKELPLAPGVAMKDFVRGFPEIKVPYNYFKHLKEFSSFLKENKDIPSLILTYEGLSHDPEKHVKMIADFIGVECSKENIIEVIEMCNFENMKRADETHKDNFLGELTRGTGILGNEFVMYRKGKVGDWKNHFTVAESETYDEIIEKEFKETGLRFHFE